MSFKEDPLGQQHKPPATLWLNQDNMAEARANWLKAYRAIDPSVDESVWNTAWAAAIAAFGYIQEGRTAPR